MFKIQVKIKEIRNEEVISDKFKKREFIGTDESSMYPQDISFQLAQDKTDLIDAFTVDQAAEVHFNIRGREWTSPQGETKYFNTLDAWKILAVGSTPVPTAFVPNIPAADLASQDDKLPF